MFIIAEISALRPSSGTSATYPIPKTDLQIKLKRGEGVLPPPWHTGTFHPSNTENRF